MLNLRFKKMDSDSKYQYLDNTQINEILKRVNDFEFFQVIRLNI